VLRHLGGHGLLHGGVGVPESVHSDAGDHVEVLASIGVPDAGALTAHDHDRRGAVVVTHDRAPAVGPLRGGHHSSTTIVPIPVSVKTSTSTACGMRPSTTWARVTPPSTASRQASIFGNIPASRVGRMSRSWSGEIWLTKSAQVGQSR